MDKARLEFELDKDYRIDEYMNYIRKFEPNFDPNSIILEIDNNASVQQIKDTLEKRYHFGYAYMLTDKWRNEDVLEKQDCLLDEKSEKYDYSERFVLVYNKLPLSCNDMIARELSYFKIQIDLSAYSYSDETLPVECCSYWEYIFPFLDQVATVIGIVGGVYTISTPIWNRYKKNPDKAHDFLYMITSKESWDKTQLAEFLDVDKEEAKNLLKGLGYEWDKGKQVYIKTPRTDQIQHNMQERFIKGFKKRT